MHNRQPRLTNLLAKLLLLLLKGQVLVLVAVNFDCWWSAMLSSHSTWAVLRHCDERVQITRQSVSNLTYRLTVGLHLGHRVLRVVLLADALWSSGGLLHSAVRRLWSRSLGSGSSHRG
jgi:hypothetical protein